MSFNYSPDLVRLLVAERQQEANLARMARKARSTDSRRWSAPVRRLFGFRPSTAQTCAC